MSSKPVDFSAILPLTRGQTLGVMGGGQLARMFAHAAQAMGYRIAVLDPDANAPAMQIAQEKIVAAYDDAAAWAQLAAVSTAVTTEFENVPAAALDALARAGRPVRPAATAVAIAQDRAAEKAHFVRCGVPCAAHAVIASAKDLQDVEKLALFPGILKTARMGYDGKGQVRVASAADLAAAWEALGRVACVLEKMLPLAAECSIIVARGANGAVVHLPVQHNLHREGILAVTQVFEGNVAAEVAQQAREAATRIAQGLDYVGVLCVEFFVLADGSLVVNEMAPRPHNSGHYSQNACDISQFELQARCLAALPLPQPRQHSAALMLNILGDIWFQNSENPQDPNWADILKIPGVHLHLYGKTQPKIARKMGHVNITAENAELAYERAITVAKILGIAPFDFAK